MARNPFSVQNASSPAHGGATVTPNDSADLPDEARSLYIGGEGNVRVITRNGNDLTFVGLPAGSILPVYVVRVYATDTTATNIIGLY